MAAKGHMAACGLASFSASDEFCWYAIYTKRQKEDLAVEYVSRMELDAFNPKVKKVRKIYGMLEEVNAPLFPCYVFARFDRSHMHSVRYARGVRRIVGAGNVPTPIDEEIISYIRSRTLESKDWPRPSVIEPGDPVVIIGGAFYGVEGIFDRHLSDKERVSVLLNTIERQARLQIEKRWVRRIGDCSY